MKTISVDINLIPGIVKIGKHVLFPTCSFLKRNISKIEFKTSTSEVGTLDLEHGISGRSKKKQELQDQMNLDL